MNNIVISNYKTKQIVFSGLYKNIKECIEDAILKGFSLKDTDLKYVNLSHANLDDGDFEGAILKGANLSGANLSETNLKNADLTNANMIGACCCYSDLTGANMNDVRFGATDIAGARMDGACFSTLSALKMNFIDALSMKDCIYIENNEPYRFSSPPIVVTGTPETIVFLDSHLKIGAQTMAYNFWHDATNDNTHWPESRLMALSRLSSEYKFFRKNRIIIEKISQTMRS